MSEEFTRQYAVRLPDGELYTQCGVFGSRAEKVLIFDTVEQAEGLLLTLAATAKAIGIDGWVGQVEHRLCSPFSVTDPGEDFADEVARWAADQGGAS